MMEVREDFYARCKECGKMYPNIYFLTYDREHMYDGSGILFKEIIVYDCPYCHKDAETEYIETLNTDLVRF